MTLPAVSDVSEADWTREIERVEDEARLAFLARDTDRLKTLWSDELVVNSPINRVLDRSQVFDLLKRGVIAHSSFDVHIEVMTRHGDVVIVMGHDVVTATPAAPPVQRRFTNVWRGSGGRWRMIARHANGVIVPGRPEGRMANGDDH
jgi:ketosteroid isomerase-like protein